MDKIKFSSIESTKLLSEIKRVVVVLMLITANDSHSAAMETTNGPSSAVSSPQKSQPTIKPAMALVSACLLTALFLICFLFFYFRRYPERQLALAAATGSGGDRSLLKLATAPGLDPAVIAAFTTFTYSAVKEIKIGQQVLECAVCLNEFYDHETLRLLPECCHVFHRECIDEWLALHVTCPVCRANLVPKPGQLSMTESCFDQNESTEDHVTVEVINLKHGGRRFSRSYSAGHSAAGRRFENVERYTLRLPDELQNALKNSVIKNPADYVGEISLKKCVRSASANYVRESSYFAYERFGQERLRLEDKV